jgi:hypothetical protein
MTLAEARSLEIGDRVRLPSGDKVLKGTITQKHHAGPDTFEVEWETGARISVTVYELTLATRARPGG